MPEVSPGAIRPEPVLKPLDAWWSVLVADAAAIRVVRFLQPHESISPTSLTIAAHLLGLVAAALFGAGELVAAAILFEIRFVLDCADGKLARVRGSSSAVGAFVDYVGDFLVVGSTMAGLALHLGWREDAGGLLVVGLPAAFLAHIAVIQSRLLEATQAGDREKPPTQRLPRRYVAWMAARRLRPAPSGIDVEHALLFLVPVLSVLLDAPQLLVGLAWVAAGYYVYRTVRIFVGGYRVAAGRDRAAGLRS